jgi:hypothetical protein
MFPPRSHQLAPLTEMTGKGRIIWMDWQAKGKEQIEVPLANPTQIEVPGLS